MKSTQWYLELSKKEKPRIRRKIVVDNKYVSETHPQKNWIHLINDILELKDYVIRLNNKDPKVERIKNKLEFTHAYIKPEFIDEYQKIYLRNLIPDESEAKKLVFYLKKYCLNFFIGRLNLANPIDWKRNESLWGLALLNKQQNTPAVFDDNQMRSLKVLKIIVYEMNRFMRFLHTKHPDVTPLVFEPLSRAVIKEHEARRKLSGEIRVTKVIKPDHWEIIKQNIRAYAWEPLVLLAYHYGLRRNEAYGLLEQDLRKGYLSIERQVNRIENKIKSYKPVKNRTHQRKVPHWFIEPKEALKLISRLHNLNTHQDTISQEFSNLCIRLNLPNYTLHDLRRTFITNAVKKQIPKEDLRLAVGHVDGSTTYNYYVLDTREMDDELWIDEFF